MDLQNFDSPTYQDTLQAVYRDMYALVNVVWNVFACVGVVAAVIGTFAMIARENWLYALLMTMAVVPATAVNRKYTKVLYY